MPTCAVLFIVVFQVHLGHFSTYRATRVESAAESGLKVWLSPKGHFGGGSRSMAGERNSPNLEVPECPYYFNFILNKGVYNSGICAELKWLGHRAHWTHFAERAIAPHAERASATCQATVTGVRI